jgi:hypothetical protein
MGASSSTSSSLAPFLVSFSGFASLIFIWYRGLKSSITEFPKGGGTNSANSFVSISLSDKALKLASIDNLNKGSSSSWSAS